MKKEEIENKDQELIKKFRTIIHNKGKKTTPRTFPFWLIFFFVVLILASILFFTLKPAPLVSTMSETSSREQLEQAPAEQPASNADTVKIKAPSDAPKTLAPPQEAVARESVAREAIIKSSDPVLSNPVPEQDSPVETSNQEVQGDMPSDISIEKIISCSSVNNRQYSKPKVEFSLAQDATAKVWMKVISQNPPFTLTHVYYFNERKYCEIPLTIRYHHMRTWSSVTLRSSDHIGRWRVEVVTDTGIKLDQIEFMVVK